MDFAGADLGYILASYLQSRGFCGRIGVQAHNLMLSQFSNRPPNLAFLQRGVYVEGGCAGEAVGKSSYICL